MIPEELVRSLAERVAREQITEVIELRTGLRVGYGQTFLVLAGGRWLAASRESVLDHLEVVSLEEAFPIVVRRGPWETAIELRAEAGEVHRLCLSVLDGAKLGRIEALVPQQPAGEERVSGADAPLEATSRTADLPDLPAPGAGDDPDVAERRAAERRERAAAARAARDALLAAAEAAPEGSGEGGEPELRAAPSAEPRPGREAPAEPLAPLPKPRTLSTPALPSRYEPTLEPPAWSPGRDELEAIEGRVVERLRAGDEEGAAKHYAEAMGAGPVLARHAVERIARSRGIAPPKRSSGSRMVLTLVLIAVGAVLLFKICEAVS